MQNIDHEARPVERAPSAAEVVARPVNVTGATVQFGGKQLLACTKGLEDDRAWFARHHGRAHRIRRPLGGERKLPPPPPRGFKRLIVVRQIKPGSRIRLDLGWRGAPPLNAEGVAAEIFAVAAEGHPRFAEIVRCLEEGRP